jgi:hypothetical protein
VQISIEPNFKDKSIAIEEIRWEEKLDWELLKSSREISSSSRKLDKIMANADVLIINNVLDEKHKRIWEVV